MAQFSNYTPIDAPADADIFLVYDDSAGATRKVTLQQLGDYIDTDQGFVTGPGSSTDNAVARFDSTTGKIVQNSGVIIDDSNNVTGVAALTATTLAGTLSTATQNSVTTMTGLTTVGTIATGVWEATDIAVLHGGTGASTAADARTNLGLAIGTNVQAYDAGLTSIAGLTTAADKMIYTTASDTYAVTDLSSFARTILDDADALTARATLGLVIGTNVQAYDADLAAIAALSSADGNFIVGSATGWVAESGATARTSLGLTIGTDVQAYSATLASVAAGTYTGATSITTLGTITTGTVPAARVSAGTFQSGAFVFAGALSGITSLTMSGALALGTGSITTTGTLASGNATVTGTLGVTGNTTISNGGFLIVDTGAVAANPRVYFRQNTLASVDNFIEMDRGTGKMEFNVAATKVLEIATTGLEVTGTLGVTSKITGTASTTSAATINLPAGTAPTSPAESDMWFVGDVMYRRIGGVTKSVTFT